MNNKILMVLGLASIPGLALAAPDFNGSWVRNDARSDREIYPLYWLTRGVEAGRTGNGEYIVSVRQDATGIVVVDQVHPQRNYVLDGKPHSVATDTGMAKASVTALVRGESLLIETVQPYGGMPGNVSLKISEAWSLSPDGKDLTVTTTYDAPAGKQVMKALYSRK